MDLRDTIAFTQNPSPMWIYDTTTYEILEVNKVALQVYGYERKEFNKLTILDLRPDEEVNDLLEFAASNQRFDGNVGIWKHKGKDGGTFWMEILAQPLSYEGRNAKLIQARPVDPTKERLSLSNHSKEVLYHLGNTSLGVVEWDRQFRVKSISNRVTEIFGYTFEDLSGLHIEDLAYDTIYPGDRNKVNEIIQHILEGNISNHQEEISIYAKDGSLKHTNWYISILRGRDEELHSVYSLIDDITKKMKLEESRNRLFRMIESTPDLIGMVNTEGEVIYLNSAGKEMLEIEHQDFRKFSATDFHPPEEAERLDKSIFPSVKNSGAWSGELRYQSPESGNIIPTSSVIIYHRSDSGEVEYYSTVSRDITKQIKNLQTIVEQKEQFKLLADNSTDKISRHTPDGTFLYVSPAVKRITGFSPEELIGRNPFDFIHPDDIQAVKKKLDTVLQSDTHSTVEYRHLKKDGSYVWVQTNGKVIKDPETDEVKEIHTITRDISDHKANEEKLKQTLREKEVLLQEIHHRVKNNLAVVSGLLDMQVFNTEDENLKRILTENQLRIITMAKIHEQLYQSKSLSNIQFDTYIKELGDSIFQTFNAGDKIDLQIDCEAFQLNINEAVPCGLIVNELLSNAIEHAFKGRDSGHITVGITKKDERITVVVKDNGIGLREDFNRHNGTSLGFTIINTLLEQLEADSNIESSDDGTSLSFTFEITDAPGPSNSLRH